MITAITSAAYGDAAQTLIDLTVNTDAAKGVVCTVSKSGQGDPALAPALQQEAGLFARAAAGEFGALAPYNAPRAEPAALKALASALAAGLLSGARLYTAAGVTIAIDASQGTRTDLTNLMQWGAANQSAKQPWIANDGSVTLVTGAQFVALGPLVGAYALAVYAALADVLAKIDTGAIATIAQLNSYAWPQ